MKTVRLIATLVLLTAFAAAGLWLAQLEGTCLDEAGKPLANAELKFLDKHNGHRFSVRTDSRGKFFFSAVEPGAYEVTVLRSKQKIAEFPAIAIGWSSRPQQLTLDLSRHSIEVKRESRQAETLGGDTSPDDMTPVVVGDDPETVAVRAAIEQAQTQGRNRDWVGAIATLKSSAESTGAKYDVVWSQLANAYCQAKNYEACVAAYGKAIERKEVGAYYNNRAQALIQLKRWNDAALDLTTAEKMNPEHRALYQQNLGMMLVQKVQDGDSEDSAADFAAAVHAFDLVLADQPKKAEIYYLRGYCQIRLLGVVSHPPSYNDIETGLKRYLDLAPQGQYASEVKEILGALPETD